MKKTKQKEKRLYAEILNKKDFHCRSRRKTNLKRRILKQNSNRDIAEGGGRLRQTTHMLILQGTINVNNRLTRNK